MAHVWIALFTTLTFLSWASSEQVVLMQTPYCNSCVWSWSTYHLTCNVCMFAGWDNPSIPGVKNRYSVCNVLIPDHTTSLLKEPNNWLQSDLIHVGEVQKVDVIVKYSIYKCPDATLFCKEFFDVFVWESKTSVASSFIPDPLTSNSSYRRFGNITRQSNNPTTSIIPLVVTSKYIVLGFRDQGGCRVLYSVKVTYNVCPQETLSQSLVSVPQTLAPISEPLPVKGSCTADSVPVQGSFDIVCNSRGEWNKSQLEGRCICKEDMENTGGKCEDCKSGEYNNQRGLNCTVLPSHPRNVELSFVNQSSATITWKPPVITGGQVFYEIDCQKTCKDCDEKTCDGEAALVSHKKSSNMTYVTIKKLSSFANYTCKITAKNRVSEVAARKHRVFANATIIKLKTRASVPGTPEVVVQQADYAFTELSWQLKCKNGIIKKYHVTYHREDDSSEKETLTTNAEETKVRIEKLSPGKTFVFQVVAENNSGRGPAGVKTFKITSASNCSSGWVRYGNSCYNIDDTPTAKQTEARTACQNMGADLPIIRSAAGNKFIFDLLKKQNTVTHLGVWLGIHRKDADSKLYWIDDTPLEGFYQNWQLGEPNNYGNDEYCAQMFGASGTWKVEPGKWNDLPCNFRVGNDAPVVLCQKIIREG